MWTLYYCYDILKNVIRVSTVTTWHYIIRYCRYIIWCMFINYGTTAWKTKLFTVQMIYVYIHITYTYSVFLSYNIIYTTVEIKVELHWTNAIYIYIQYTYILPIYEYYNIVIIIIRYCYENRVGLSSFQNESQGNISHYYIVLCFISCFDITGALILKHNATGDTNHTIITL